MAKRRFGRVRKLPSGRYQARYAGPDGVDRPAPKTFASKTDADVWLTMKEAEIRRGDWHDPDAGKVLFGAYAETWINDHVLKPRTEELYRAACSRITCGRLSATWTSARSARQTSGDGARNG